MLPSMDAGSREIAMVHRIHAENLPGQQENDTLV